LVRARFNCYGFELGFGKEVRPGFGIQSPRRRQVLAGNPS